MIEDRDTTILGKTNFRNRQVDFGIKADDRRRHIYIIGKTGTGKTTMMENMIIDDILAGRGVGLIDPHGEFVEKIINFIPEERTDDVIYFNPDDTEFPIAFNPLESVAGEHRHLVASGVMGVFKKIWPDVWSARMEYILNNTLLALLEYPESTLLGIMRMLAEKEYRAKVVQNLQDPVVKSFWANEFARYTQRLETEAVAAIQNKVGQFVSNPLIRNVLGQSHSSIDLRQVMNQGKILLANLSKGRIGEDNSALLGAMLITKLQLAAMKRIDIPEAERKDFHLYIDEFQNFSTESFVNVLSEARKYRLSLVLAHQYISQLGDYQNSKVRDAIFGNIGTIILFRTGAEDAEFLEKEFAPTFEASDLVNLPNHSIYVRLMIDGVASKPFSASTLGPKTFPQETFADLIIENSRRHFGTPRPAVEKRIASEWGSDADIVEEKAERRGEERLGILANQPPPRRKDKHRKPIDKAKLKEVLEKTGNGTGSK